MEQVVMQVFAELGAPIENVDELARTVLVRDGHYCGHSFRSHGLRAVWFPDANEVKFYDENGPLLRCVPLEDEMTRRPAAA